MSNFDWSSNTALVTGRTGSFGNKFVEILLEERRAKATRYAPAVSGGQRTEVKLIRVTYVGQKRHDHQGR